VQQPVVSPWFVLPLILALWVFTEWLDRPIEDLPSEAERRVREIPSMHRRCISDATETSASHHAAGPQLAPSSSDASSSTDLDPSDAAPLRCRAVN